MFVAASYITCVPKSVKRLPALKNRVLSAKQNKWSHFVTGALGERRAEKLLIYKHYLIIDKNVVFKNYELDLVALDRRFNEIVFIEVKTRHTSWYGHPSNAVNRLKLRSLNRAARGYLQAKGLRNLYRFDIIAVTPQGVEHFENITWP